MVGKKSVSKVLLAMMLVLLLALAACNNAEEARAEQTLETRKEEVKR